MKNFEEKKIWKVIQETQSLLQENACKMYYFFAVKWFMKCKKSPEVILSLNLVWFHTKGMSHEWEPTRGVNELFSSLPGVLHECMFTKIIWNTIFSPEISFAILDIPYSFPPLHSTSSSLPLPPLFHSPLPPWIWRENTWSSWNILLIYQINNGKCIFQ